MTRDINGAARAADPHRSARRPAGSAEAVTADREVVRRVHSAVVARLAEELKTRPLTPADQRQMVLAWVQTELHGEATRRAVSRERQLDHAAERAVARAVENTLWGLGRIQELLDVPGVEDIYLRGNDLPMLRLTDGSVLRADTPVADTDADLIAHLQHIGAHHG